MKNEQQEADWLTVKDKYQIGQIITGKVLTIKPFGLFVDIGEKSVRGFIRVVDITDKDKIYNPKEFNIEDDVEGIILGFTDYNYQVLLSLKDSDFKRYE